MSETGPRPLWSGFAAFGFECHGVSGRKTLYARGCGRVALGIEPASTLPPCASRVPSPFPPPPSLTVATWRASLTFTPVTASRPAALDYHTTSATTSDRATPVGSPQRRVACSKDS